MMLDDPIVPVDVRVDTSLGVRGSISCESASLSVGSTARNTCEGRTQIHHDCLRKKRVDSSTQ